MSSGRPSKVHRRANELPDDYRVVVYLAAGAGRPHEAVHRGRRGPHLLRTGRRAQPDKLLEQGSEG